MDKNILGFPVTIRKKQKMDHETSTKFLKKVQTNIQFLYTILLVFSQFEKNTTEMS